MELHFTDSAKTLVAAIKVLCGACRTLPIKPDPAARNLVIAQQSDNNVAWLELSVVNLDFSGPPDSAAAIARPRLVESKPLAAAMRGVTTLRDELTLRFMPEALVVRTLTRKGEDETAVETELPYQSDEVFFMDASPCRGDALVAGRTDHPTKELESLIKDAVGVRDVVRDSAVVRVHIEDGRVFFGEHSMEDVTLCVGAGAYDSLFDAAALQTYVRSSLCGEVALQLYRDLPLKLMYSLISSKKRRSSKKAAAAAPPSPGAAATLEIYIAPRA
jgi:hypothetical protein